MLVQFIHSDDLPQHIKCDFKDNYFDETENNQHFASLKRNQKYIDTTTYENIRCLIFPNCIKFFVKSEYYIDFRYRPFAVYDWSTDTIYRFNNSVVSLSIDIELFGITKQDIIDKLMREQRL